MSYELTKGIACVMCKEEMNYSDELVFFNDGVEVFVTEQTPDWTDAICTTCYEESVSMLSSSNRKLVLEDNKPIACEDCAPCDVYLEAGHADEDVIWKRCIPCTLHNEKLHRDFWNEKLKWRLAGDVTEHGQKVVRVEGHHYVLGNGNSVCLGSAGRKFVFEFIDGPHKGQVVTCNDVWYQGAIPKDYEERLPSNANYVRHKDSI